MLFSAGLEGGHFGGEWVGTVYDQLPWSTPLLARPLST